MKWRNWGSGCGSFLVAGASCRSKSSCLGVSLMPSRNPAALISLSTRLEISALASASPMGMARPARMRARARSWTRRTDSSTKPLTWLGSIAPNQVKSAVERSCGLLERELARMAGTLGGICAGSLGEFNQALARAVGEINRRPFEKKAGGCRQSLCEQCGKPVLRPCPAVPFEACEWRICHADKQHMATVDGKRYMVRYLLAGKEVRACVGSARITFYNPADNSAAGSYARDYAEGCARHEDECLMSPAELAFRRGPGECRQWFCSHGLGLPRILALVDAIYSKDGAAMIRYRRISSLKGMCAKFGAEAVDKACMNAAAGGRPLTAAVLRGLLEHGCKPGAAKSATRRKPPRGAAASEAFLQSDWTVRGGSHD